MKKIFVLAFALFVNVLVFAYTPEWQTLNKKFDVKGGAGIEQLVMSLGIFSKDYLEPDNFDKKNGFFEFFEEGDGHCKYNACYWNRSDGKKLFIISYDCIECETLKSFEDVTSPWGYCEMQDTNEEYAYIYDTGCMAYIYNEATKQLVPMKTPPFKGLDMSKRNHYFLELPQKGKDIIVREHLTWEITVSHTLKWNGMAFDFVKSPTSVIDLYRIDKDGEKTNIRNAPNGKVVTALESEGIFNMFIDKIQDGWCHIMGDVVYEMSESHARYLEGSSNGFWIHNSVIGASGMGAGGVTLRMEPSSTAKVVFKSDDYTVIHPVELKGDWIKVSVDKTKTQGWIHKSDICSNPVTNCC